MVDHTFSRGVEPQTQLFVTVRSTAAKFGRKSTNVKLGILGIYPTQALVIQILQHPIITQTVRPLATKWQNGCSGPDDKIHVVDHTLSRGVGPQTQVFVTRAISAFQL